MLDRRQLSRLAGDPERIARLVGRRTTQPAEAIISILRADTGGGRSAPAARIDRP